MHKSCEEWLYSCTYANTRQTHVVSNWFQYVNGFDGDDLVHVLLFKSKATHAYI